MKTGGRARASPLAALIRSLCRIIALALLLLVITGLAMPMEALAYKEAMSELVVGGNPGLIVQNQSYSTSTRQNLFHSATAAGTDAEAFAFGGTPLAGINLAQTSSALATGTETGYFDSTASTDIVPPVHIGNGFLGTWIDDPIQTGTPIFAGLTFPEMMKTDTSALASQQKGLAPTGNNTGVKNNATGNKTQKDVTVFQPVIAYDVNNALTNDTIAGPGVSNARKQNASSTNAMSKPAATPVPAIKPGQVFYHQQNKPFSANLTAPYGPFRATPEKIQNTSGFDRFLINTVGRSTTDKAFNGTTSSPTYITPGAALAEQIPYDFIQGARGMTMPGTHLNCRAWPL